VGLVDVLPTLIELAGLPNDRQLDGRSIAAAMRSGPLAEQDYLAEVQDRVPLSSGFDVTAVAAYSGDLKLVLGDDGARLYELDADPNGETPLRQSAWPEAAGPLAVAAARHRDIASEMKPGDREALSRDVEEELRALGYLR
jgi:arylsulfatase A-like enzyme